MSNPIKDIFDKESMSKDIAERENIIYNYQRCGLLDRDNAINKIQELRMKDADVLAVAFVNIAAPYIPIFLKEFIQNRIMVQPLQLVFRPDM